MPLSVPWFSIWGQPKSTIREIVHSNPRQGVFFLASVCGLFSGLYFSNWWSLGLSYSFYQIFLSSLILAPVLGFFWLYLLGWVLYFSGRLLKGAAPAVHIRSALAWSRAPYLIGVFIWLILMIANPDTVFIQDAGGPSSVFVNFISLALEFWSFILLVQTLREVQGFGVGRSVLNIVIAGFCFFVIFVILFNIFRYLYILTV